jgi:hypothetical protein
VRERPDAEAPNSESIDARSLGADWQHWRPCPGSSQSSGETLPWHAAECRGSVAVVASRSL